MNPEHTIRTAGAGRRAAAIRDGRAEAGDATTQVIAKHAPAPWSAHCEAGWWWVTDGSHGEVAGDLMREDAHLIAAAPNMLAALRALVAVAPANAHEDPELQAAVSAANQAIGDAEGRRRCDQCCGTGYMRLLSTHRTVPCTRCRRA